MPHARRRTSIKGRLKTIALFGCLGFITAVLISWMFALFGSLDRRKEQWIAAVRHSVGQSSPIVNDIDWPCSPPSGWPEPIYRQSTQGRGLRLDRALGAKQQPDSIVELNMVVLQSGWPFYAFRWRQLTQHSTGEGQASIESGEIELPDFAHEWFLKNFADFPVRRRLPIEPVWPGFALNTAIFGGGLWLVVRGRSTMRTLLRSRRGQCLQCGYDRRGSATQTCPECGK